MKPLKHFLYLYMPIIRIETFINADQATVFDLARSIDLHQISTVHTNERAVAGKMSGLIELNESVTWEARHFGVVQRLSSKITEMKSPEYFVDEMVFGAFKSFRHEHIFEAKETGTLMTDVFNYISPLGVLGKLANVLFLNRYVTDLLVQRNKVLKEYSERKQGQFEV
ncbi:SRPBCC family protein [Pedobacter panaciterrae]